MLSFLKKYFSYLALAFILSSYFFFGFQHIGKFVTADEHYWVYERIPQYWDAIAQGKWQKTFINDKPGVSVALVSGIGLLFEPHPEKYFHENPDRTLTYDVENSESFFRLFRLPILIINSLLLIYLFWIISRLTNRLIAFWTTAFTALSPILLGISQIINPDALLWSFGTTALFSYFAFLSFKERKFLWLTIILTGFAILTKYVAFILLPFYLALIIFHFLAQPKTESDENLSHLLKKNIVSWIAIVAGSITMLCFFLPALLVSSKYFAELIMTVPDKELLTLFGGGFLTLFLIDTFALKSRLLFILRKTALSVIDQTRFFSLFFFLLFVGLIIIRNFFPDWDIFTLIPFDIKDLSDARYHAHIPNFFEAFLLEWNPIVFSLTPIALIGIAAFLILFSKKTVKEYAFIAYSLLFFLLTYSLLLIYSNILTTPRYSILLYPLLAFLAALGLWHALKKSSWPYTKHIATGIILLGSLSSLIIIKPFYFNYTNFLLPKSAIIHDAWGYGGYEAAEYLNGLPDAENLTVWIDYYGVCEFFVGKCLNAYTFDANIIRPDYYVLTRRGQMRYMSRYSRWERLSGLTAYKYYAQPDPAWQLFIGDRPANFIKVVKVEK